MNRNCAARRLAVSALFGLPAALVAHLLVFGTVHAAGGSAHVLALTFGVAFAVAAIAFSARGSMREPRCDSLQFAGIAISASLWLSVLELLETPHAIPVALCLIAVVAGALAILVAARAVTHTIAAIAQALGARVRIDTRYFARARLAQFVFRQAGERFARFGRAPPVFS